MNLARREYPAAPQRRWLFVPFVVFGVGVVGVLARSRRSAPRLTKAVSPQRCDVLRVRTSRCTQRVTGFGSARPQRTWTAVAEVGGRVVKVHPRLRAGQAVASGELLVEIDPHDHQLRVAQRQAELDQALAEHERLVLAVAADRASLTIQQDLLELRRLDLSRLEQLRSGAAASLREIDSSREARLKQQQAVQSLRNSLSLYPAQIRAAKALVRLARGRVEEAERDLARTRVVAPFDGLLADAGLEPGQTLTVGQTILRLHDVDRLEIEAQLSLSQLAKLRQVTSSTNTDAGGSSFLSELRAEVLIRSGELELCYRATPLALADAYDERTRTLGVVVCLEPRTKSSSPGDALVRPGSFCQVSLSPRRSTAALLVAQRCLLAGPSVLVVDAAGIVLKRAVRVAFTLGDQVALAGGVMDGDRVLLEPTDVQVGAIIVPNEVELEVGGR